MRRARIATGLALAALALPAAAGALESTSPVDPSIADGSAQRALDAARTTWRGFAGRGHYAMRISLTCFCTPDAFRPHPLEVRGGRPVAPYDPGMRPYATVRRLFARVQRAIDQRVALLQVDYGAHGVPRDVGIDVSFMIADEELGIHVRRFRALD
jgi:hypothetical protein